MFDNDGSLVLPEGVFKNVEIPKSEWKVKCLDLFLYPF